MGCAMCNVACGVFKRGGYKIEKILHKNQHTQRKLLNFDFWINGELSNIDRASF